MIPEQNRTTEEIFPVLIQVSKHPEAESFNQKLMAEVETIRATTPNGKPDGWSCDVYTTISNEGYLHERPAFKEFSEFSLVCADYFGHVMGYGYENKVLDINECWLNVYQQGHSQEIHNHPNHLVTGVYYLKTPKDCPSLVFHSPFYKSMIRPEVTQHTIVNSMTVPYKPSEGELVIFDSAVRHSVAVNEAPGERISVAVNFALRDRQSFA
tara:strand:+ start:141 stop:773 length:633 start_codon:yes stop_codon:yes gene_type:complete